MIVKIKRLVEEAVIPSYAKNGDAGLDLTAVSTNTTDTYTEYGTGLSIEIPDGFVGLIFPRSSISKKAILLANSVGVIDSSFRGEVKLRFKTEVELCKAMVEKLKEDEDSEFPYYEVGERIGQLVILPYPQIEFQEVDELSETERGEGGFGSTNK